MISDKLYELAFAYKKTKLWKKLQDMEVFAVRLSDGTIGYISIMGAQGEYCALGLYLGEEGFESFRAVAKEDPFMLPSLERWEFYLQQNCLQCAFVGKDELSEEECEQARGYARAHGIRIAGKNAYPQFLKYQPNCLPWHLQTEQEQKALCEALAAAIETANCLEKQTREQLGLNKLGPTAKEIPILEQRDGVFVWGKAKLPEEKPKKWPTPGSCNEIGVKKLKNAQRAGTWECQVIRSPEPVQAAPEEIPYFPPIFMAAESSLHYVLPAVSDVPCEDAPEGLLNAWIDALLRENICPMEIKARDERTYALLKEFCDRLKIGLSIEEELPALEDAEQEFFKHFGMDGEDETDGCIDILDVLLELDDEQLRELPAGMVEHLRLLLEEGDLPDELADRLKRRFHFEDAD